MGGHRDGQDSVRVGRQGDDGHRLREVWTEVRRTAQGMRTGGGLQVTLPLGWPVAVLQGLCLPLPCGTWAPVGGTGAQTLLPH